MGRLFGTDGARGVANSELTCELAMKIGRAAAMVLTESCAHKPKVLIGMDTRASSHMLAAAIGAGLCSVGADVLIIDVVPTPAVAFLVKEYDYDAGVMISASHNPCEYNGIKIFQGNGYKLPDELENEIEEIILDETKVPPVVLGGDVGKISFSSKAVDDYIFHLAMTADGDFKGMKIALDCANGSASVTARALFTRLGAKCCIINETPNGTNINENCGSTHLEQLQKFVVENKCDIGFAFDGDADRLLVVDENGEVVDGDKIIAVCSKFMKENNKLKNNTAVVTVMSNMGFFKFCEKNDINCVKTKVGDRYVLEEMVKNGFVIGGEQSGHIIFLDYATTGDGQMSAIQVLNVLKSTGKKISELASEMQVYPQVLINVRVSNFGKARLDKDEEVQLAIREASEELGDTGRVLVRVSGTEPLVRVMLEGEDYNQIKSLAESIAKVIEERLV
ncbi:MAG: phosphoglucosamine mutase [Ruminococcus sp.]|nr:phosphoglucosamine mutase [Ruminococcus sp.]MDY4908938.1 phosphoglucosamine mutase [Candidatus Fimenecus sp.]